MHHSAPPANGGIAGIIIGILAALPILFPLGAQLDNGFRLETNSGARPATWHLLALGNTFIAIYFTLHPNKAYSFAATHYFAAFLAVACWVHDRYRISRRRDRGRTALLMLAAYTAVLAAICVFAIKFVFTQTFRGGTSTAESFGSVGATLYAAALLVLPPNDQYAPDGPLGGFSFLSLGAQFSGYFAVLVTILLLFSHVDFFGAGIVGFLMAANLVSLGIRRLRSSTLVRDEYFSIPLQNISRED